MPQQSRASAAVARLTTSSTPTRGAQRRGRASLSERQHSAAAARATLLRSRAAVAGRHNEYVEAVRGRALADWEARAAARSAAPLEERLDSAARVRAGLLEGKAASAGRHNVYVDIVRERARREWEEKVKGVEVEARRKIKEAEIRRKRGREGSDAASKRLKRVKANREEMFEGLKGKTEGRLREAEMRRAEYLEMRSRRAARLAQRGEIRARVKSSGRSAAAAGQGSVPSVAPAAVAPAPARVKAPSTSGSATLKTPQMAARRIASCWLLSRARRCLRASGLLSPPEAATTYEGTEAAMQTGDAADAMRLFLRAIDSKLSQSSNQAKIALSCFLVAFHPQNVLDFVTGDASAKAEEDDVVLLLSARRLVYCLRRGSVPAVATAWVQWGRSYMRWLRSDKERMIAGMVADALETEALRRTIRQGRGGDGAAEVTAIWEAEIDRRQKQLRDAVLQLGGEAEVAKLDAELRRAQQMPDEKLAHEIMVDLEGFIRGMEAAVLPQSLWANLRDELLTVPPKKDELFSLLAHLELQLNTMRPGSLDPVRRGDLDAANAADFACGFVQRAAAALKLSQSAAADEPLAEWLDEALQRLIQAREAANNRALVSVVSDLLQEFADRVGKVHNTVSGMRVRACAPVVQQYGVAWERVKFNDRLSCGEFVKTLPRLRSFLRAARCDTPGAAPSGTAKYSRALLRESLVTVCRASAPVTATTVPEILRLDVDRLVSFQDSMQRIALLAALDNTARQFLSSARRKGSLSLDFDLELLRTALESDSASMEGIQGALIAAVSAAIGSASLTAEEQARLRGMVERTVAPSELFNLVFARVSTHLRNVLLSAERGEHDERQFEPVLGLAAVQSELTKLAAQMESLASHTWSVHGVLIMSTVSSLEE